MGVNSYQIATRTNLLNNLGYRVGTGTTQCVTGEYVDSLNPKPNITTDNYSSNKTYSNFTTAEILNTTIVEKKYTSLSVTPVSNKFTLDTVYDASKFERTTVWSFDISKIGSNTDLRMQAVSMNFSLTGMTTVPTSTNKIGVDVYIGIANYYSYDFSSGYGEMTIPSSATSTSSTTVTIQSKEANINFTSDYSSNFNDTDFNGLHFSHLPNTAYIKVIIRSYFYDLNNNKTYMDIIPSNMKISFNNTPVITARCKSKLVKFSTLSSSKAVLPFRFGLHSNGVTALSVDNMYLYGHIPTDDGSSFTKVTLASHTGLSNTGNGEYKKYLDYIVINPEGTLTPEKFVNTSSYASFAAGTTGVKRHWYVYLINGTATDFNNISGGGFDVGIEESDAKSINAALTYSGNGKRKLLDVIRDNWGVMLEVMR